MGPQKNRFLSEVTTAGPLKCEGGGDLWRRLKLQYCILFPTPQEGAHKAEYAGCPQSRVCQGSPKQSVLEAPKPGYVQGPPNQCVPRGP